MFENSIALFNYAPILKIISYSKNNQHRYLSQNLNGAMGTTDMGPVMELSVLPILDILVVFLHFLDVV